MHPAFIWWWKNRHSAGSRCEARAGCGPRAGGHAGDGPGAEARCGPDDGGGPFGVRRPLRFLANRLELREAQIEELARILNELKTERAQAEVDHQRTLAAFADALSGEAFDATRAGEGGRARVASAERLRDAVLHALAKIHAVLDEPQRKKLATLVRTGVLTM